MRMSFTGKKDKIVLKGLDDTLDDEVIQGEEEEPQQKLLGNIKEVKETEEIEEAPKPELTKIVQSESIQLKNINVKVN